MSDRPDLVGRTTELINIPSVSHDEEAITNHIASLFEGLDAQRLRVEETAGASRVRAARVSRAGEDDSE